MEKNIKIVGERKKDPRFFWGKPTWLIVLLILIFLPLGAFWGCQQELRVPSTKLQADSSRKIPIARPLSEKEIKVLHSWNRISSRFLSTIPEEFKAKWGSLLEEKCQKKEVPIEIALAIIKAESNFDPRALSENNCAGYPGINLKFWQNITQEQAFNPLYSIPWMINYLRYLYDKYHCSEKVLIAYNAGEEALLNPKRFPNKYQAGKEYAWRVFKIANEATGREAIPSATPREIPKGGGLIR